MKQLGLAIQLHHETRLQFPPGSISYDFPGCEETAVGWDGICVYNPPEVPYMVHLYPFLEQNVAYRQMDLDFPWYPGNGLPGRKNDHHESWPEEARP